MAGNVQDFEIVGMQDFEDWDDVGLNVPRPPDLVQLYRDFSQHIKPGNGESSEVECQVDFIDKAMEKEREEFTKLKEQLVLKHKHFIVVFSSW